MRIDAKLFTSKDTAKYLGYAEKTLRESRMTGKLAGVKAPQHLKFGRSIRYERADLDSWIAQFPKLLNTAQPSV